MRLITYGSVCSGIEAASVAWEPLGMSPEWFAEIEPFPCAVLAHHWPDVANLGDMTIIPAVVDMGYMSAPDVLVGGTPCQAYSVAGKREGLSDPRGMLTLKFVEIADAIDRQRDAGDECVVVWENVPGVLSSKDNAFGCFLGDLAGEDCELIPPGRKWSNAGCVFGPKRTVAWRILDAQYFGVAQRRRRVFVVASARKDFDPTAVLFEREGVRRDTAPSREKGSVVATLTANGVGTCGADDNQGQAGHLIAVHGTQDPDTNNELAHTLGRNHGQENAVFHTTGAGWWNQDDVSGTLRAREQESHEHLVGGMAVRRLTPVECERLQGFPDGHTQVPYRGKLASDGPRYKALGNSMAVCCMEWIGRRIVEQLGRL